MFLRTAQVFDAARTASPTLQLKSEQRRFLDFPHNPLPATIYPTRPRIINFATFVGKRKRSTGPYTRP